MALPTLDGVTLVDVGARSDIAVMGKNEDGEDVHGYRAYVYVEAADGRRWAHLHGFVHLHEEKALARADKLAAKVGACQRALDTSMWTRIEACYGSPAREDEESQMTPAELAGEVV